MFSIGDIIDLAVQIEKNAENLFRDAATKATNLSLVSMLHRLVDEEIKHAEWFSELKQKVQKTVEDPRLEEMGKAILRDSLGDQTFSLKDVDFSSLDQVETLLKRVIEYENDTILFYEMIRSFVEGQGIEGHLDAIIEEEESHVRLLQEFLDGESERDLTNGKS